MSSDRCRNWHEVNRMAPLGQYFHDRCPGKFEQCNGKWLFSAISRCDMLVFAGESDKWFVSLLCAVNPSLAKNNQM